MVAGEKGHEVLHRAHWENLCAQTLSRIQSGDEPLEAVRRLMDKVNKHFGIDTYKTQMSEDRTLPPVGADVGTRPRPGYKASGGQ